MTKKEMKRFNDFENFFGFFEKGKNNYEGLSQNMCDPQGTGVGGVEL